MTNITSLQDILALKEDYDIEFKKALGKDGKGKLPDDFFETYSAMANSYGGNVFLGIKEIDKGIEIAGIKEPESIKKDLFDILNNKQKISANILKDDDVEVLQFDDSYVVKIHIPQATRQQKPIYKGQNPLQGTYKRQYEGDYKCDAEYIKRMLADLKVPFKLESDKREDDTLIHKAIYVEEGTNHKRILELLDLHPSDISNLLKKLVDNGFLVSDGIGRGTIYQAIGLKEIAGGANSLAGGVNKITGGVNQYLSQKSPLSHLLRRINSPKIGNLC